MVDNELMTKYKECEKSDVARGLFDAASQALAAIGCTNMMFTSHCEEHVKDGAGCNECISMQACNRAMLLFHLASAKLILNNELSKGHGVFKMLDSMRDILMQAA